MRPRRKTEMHDENTAVRNRRIMGCNILLLEVVVKYPSRNRC
jgi:hypothetical protein